MQSMARKTGCLCALMIGTLDLVPSSIGEEVVMKIVSAWRAVYVGLMIVVVYLQPVTRAAAPPYG